MTDIGLCLKKSYDLQEEQKMRATVLTDNIGNELTPGEWGLSFYIEYGEKKVLLDAGKSGLFAENAQRLGLSLEDVDYAVLSHAHYDHADGMEEFFRRNTKAKLYLRESCGEGCYDLKGGQEKYIGIRPGLLAGYAGRLERVAGDFKVEDGIWLVGHKTPKLSKTGEREHMYLKQEETWIADDFSHEQSLVFDTGEGLVIFNSCSHSGADNIIREVTETFPGREVRAMIGGFHLYNKSEEYVRRFVEKIRAAEVDEIWTGHCTGEEAYRILEAELGDRVRQLRAGLRIDLSM